MRDIEKEFHDRLYRENLGSRRKIMPFYEVSRKARERFFHLLLNYMSPGMKVLELGCGTGSIIFLLAEWGAEVIGIDISEEAIRQAKGEAKRRGIENKILLLEMDAEKLDLPDNFFDIICGIGILHHLNLQNTYREIARVLKPTGRAIFLEPLGHNPVINYFRSKTPHLRSPNEHPLLKHDIKLAGQFFRIVKAEWYSLFSLCAIPFLKTILKEPVLVIGEAMDRFLLFNSEIGKFAWQVILILEDPVSPG